MIAVFFDALLYAATVKVLSLGSREFGLYNLAGGAWLVLGGWMAATAAGPLVGAPAPVRPWVFALFLLPALLQVAAPLVLGNKIAILRDSPLVYLFITLGIALVILSVGPGLLLENFGDTIPIQQGWWGWLFLALCSALVAGVVYRVFNGRRWARLVIDFRVAQPGNRLPLRLSALLMLELVLLLVLGAAGYQVHKGIFQTAEYRTVIPVLCLAIFSSSPGRAALLSFVIVAGSHLLDAWVPPLTGYSIPVAIAALIIAVLVRNLPRETVVDNNATAPAPQRSLSPGEDSVVVGAVIFTVLTFFATLALSWSSEVLLLHRTLLVAVIVTVSWIAQRHLGVLSIAWPVLATVAVYVVEALEGRPFYMAATIILGAAAWACYVLTLRLLSKESALVVDLSVVICIHHVVLNSTAIAGATNVKLLSYSAPSWGVITLQVALVITSLGLLYWANRDGVWRGSALGLVNFKLGNFHGVSVVPVFVGTAGALALVAIISTVGYHVLPTPVSPDELSMAAGLSVLLIGNFMHIKGPAPGFLVVFLVYGLMGALLVGRGILSGAAVGLAFVSFVLFTELFRASRRYAKTA